MAKKIRSTKNRKTKSKAKKPNKKLNEQVQCFCMTVETWEYMNDID